MVTVLDNFSPIGGKHCITNSLKQVFDYNNYPITEEMLLGIASGLGFVYLNLANSPMIGGRSKVYEFEKKIASRLNIDIKCKKTKNYTIALDKSKELIMAGQPVFIYVDMPYLKYFNLDESNHFGGHAVVIFGFDETKETFYVSDRDNANYPIRTPKGNIAEDFHLVPYEEMEKARSSTHRPFPANNGWLEFDFSKSVPISQAIITEAIKDNCAAMLNPPAKLLGVSGINKFSQEVLKWRKFPSEKIKLAGTTNYFMINADGGTGGGAFRNMYGLFLLQASDMFELTSLKPAGEQFLQISKQWDHIADLFWQLGETGKTDILEEVSSIAKDICEAEKNTLYDLSDSIK